MKRVIVFFILLLLFVLSSLSFADQWVNGYFRNNGTYVEGYFRSDPDNTVTNNFSYKGNVNPYTGQIGTNRYIHDPSSDYYEGRNSNNMSFPMIDNRVDTEDNSNNVDNTPEDSNSTDSDGGDNSDDSGGEDN